MASASSRVRVEAEPWPKKMPPKLDAPGWTKRRLVPRDWIISVMEACAPRPMDMREMTAATPMTMPNTVRLDRSLLAQRDVRADRAVSRGFI